MSITMGYPLAIYVAIGAFILLDIATGLAQAIYNGEVSSKILRNGMFHKLSYVFAIALALLVEYAGRYLELGFDVTLFIPLAVYIVLTESVSILENITCINPDLISSPVFKWLGDKKGNDNEQD